MKDPNILLIVCDTLRADHLGCYGYFRDTSPNIDRVAREGVLFEDFFNAGSPTGPGFTCFATGLHAVNHRFYRFGEVNVRQVDDTVFTMAEIMNTAGYTTVAVDNLINFAPHSKHWQRGYDFTINPSRSAFFSSKVRAEAVNAGMLPWLASFCREKFFLFAHYWDPHAPYNQPDAFQTRFHHEPGDRSDLAVEEAPVGYEYVPGWGRLDRIVEDERKWRGCGKVSIDRYDGEIAYMDREIGKVLRALEREGILDETLVVITSDHGEQLGQHDIWGHAALHDAETRIPLIMRHPRLLPENNRVKGLCQQVDLLPTLLELLGRNPGILDIDGRSMLPLLDSREIRDFLVVENASGQRALRTKRHHLLDSTLLDPNWVKYPHDLELYNVHDDPMETLNLVASEGKTATELRARLDEWVAERLHGGSDPIVYENWPRLLAAGREYGDKIRRLQEAMGGGLHRDQHQPPAG